MLPYYIDQNEEKLPPSVTPVVTDNSQHEVRCGMCARELYVDNEGYRRFLEAIDSGLDNPFRCDNCRDEYDDLAYEG
jgi:hypothetical protein